MRFYYFNLTAVGDFRRAAQGEAKLDLLAETLTLTPESHCRVVAVGLPLATDVGRGGLIAD